MLTVFEFLSNFLAGNYSSDYEVQFTSHILPELINSTLEYQDKTLEAAEEALEAYIRSHKKLENVLDYLVRKPLSSDDPHLGISGIKLAIKNIEYHPKVISADSRSFITFIEKLCLLRGHKDTNLATEARTSLMEFLKRFPATMKEIANEMESRDIKDLTKLIKIRNEAIEYKKAKKQRAMK